MKVPQKQEKPFPLFPFTELLFNMSRFRRNSNYEEEEPAPDGLLPIVEKTLQTDVFAKTRSKSL